MLHYAKSSEAYAFFHTPFFQNFFTQYVTPSPMFWRHPISHISLPPAPLSSKLYPKDTNVTNWILFPY